METEQESQLLQSSSGRAFVVAREDELPEHGMLEVEAEGRTILLVRQNGEVSALGAHCPHYGAPLAQGLLHDGCITCPWHKSSFDATSGDLREPPSLDALPRYECRVENGNVVVLLPEQKTDRRTPAMATESRENDRRIFVIVGAGAAGVAAAEMLRTLGYRGRILMLTGEESSLPYDRPSCSKGFLRGETRDQKMLLRRAEFYQRYGIELRHDMAAVIDVPNRSVQLTSGEILEPDVMLLATGGTPRNLETVGAWFRGVYTLRTWEDSRRIREEAQSGRRAVIAGASFIGMETAAALIEHGLEVTVVAPEEAPFASSLGPEVADFIQRLHAERGVRFRLGRTVKAFDGRRDQLERAVLDDGSTLDADIAVVGLGIRPTTHFVKGANLNPDGSIDVDEHLQVREGVFAAGDIARYPEAHLGERVRIEHWRLAQQQGRVAARNMLGHRTPFRKVPFFWTRHYDVSVGYCGYAPEWDSTHLAGDLEERRFTAYFVRDGRIVAAAGTQVNELTAFGILLDRGRLPDPADLGSDEPEQLRMLLEQMPAEVNR